MQPQLGRLTGANGGAGGRSAYLNASTPIGPQNFTDNSLGGQLYRVQQGLLNFGKQAVVDPVLRGGQALTQIQTNNIQGKPALQGVDTGQLAGDTLQTGLNFVPGDQLLGLGKDLATKLVPGLAAKAVDAGARVASKAATAGPQLGNALTDVGQAAAKTSMAGKATSAANGALAAQYGAIHTPVGRANDLLGTVGKLADMGIIKPQDAERIANGFTGANGLGTDAVSQAVEGASKYQLDATKLKDLAGNALIDNQVATAPAKAFNTMLDRQIQKISTDGTAGSVMDVVRNLEGKRADLLGQSGGYHLPTTDDKSLAAVHTAVADSLKNGVDGAADVSKVLTSQLRDSLVALHPGVPKWQNFVDNTVMKSANISALRSTQAPFVKISKVIQDAAQNAGTAGGKVANSVLNGPGGLVKSLIRAGATSAPVQRGTAAVLKGVAGGAGATAGVGGAVKAGVGATANVLGRIPVGIDAAAIGTAGSQASSPQTDPNAANLTPTPPAGQTDTTGAQDASSSPFSPSVLQAMALHDIQTTGGKNLAKIQALNSMFGAGSKAAKTSAATQKDVVSINNASTLLDQMISQLHDAGGAQGPLGGRIVSALGQAGMNDKVQAYNKTRGDAAIALATAFNNGGKPSAQIIQQVKDSLPLITDTPGSASQAVQLLKTRLEGRLQNAQNTPITSADFTSLAQ